MAGPNPHAAARVVARGKKRQAADVIEMGVAIEQVQLGRLARCHQLVAQQPEAGAAIEDHQVTPAPDLDTRGVAAIADRIWPGAGDAAAHTPKSHRVIRMDQGPIPVLPLSPARIYRREGVETLDGLVPFPGISKTFLEVLL